MLFFPIKISDVVAHPVGSQRRWTVFGLGPDADENGAAPTVAPIKSELLLYQAKVID